jgi:hypothetical protein
LTAQRLVRKDNPDIATVGTLERLTGVARVKSAARVGDRFELHYAGGTDVDWDNQVTVHDALGRVFVDENGERVSKDNVLLEEAPR